TALQVGAAGRDSACGANDRPLLLRAPLRYAFARGGHVWSLGSGVAIDVDYVAAELPADGPRTLHEWDAAGVLPSEAPEVESRAGRRIEPNPSKYAGREPGAARSG